MSDKKRILIADDSEVVTTLLVTALEVQGFEVAVARNGQEAFEMGKDEDFDLAILDQLMPGLLGNEILKRWQEEEIALPTIVLSGVEDDELVVKFLQIGAVDFVRKPFRLAELIARVNMHIR